MNKFFTVIILLAVLAMTNVALAEDPPPPAPPAGGAAPAEAPKADATPAASPEASPAATAEKKEYVCEHCSVVKDAPGKCEKCGAELKEKAAAPAADKGAGEKKEEPKPEEKK